MGGIGGRDYDYGVTGGAGGGAILTAGNTSLTNNSQISLQGGNGGSAPTGGNGGNAGVSMASLSLDSSSSLIAVGGNGDTAGGGLNGSANVTIGDLEGAGSVSLFSNGNSTLQVSSGNFSGSILGDSGLDKTGKGTLALLGVNSYSGATSIDGGVLNIQGNQNLGLSNQLTLNGGTLQAGTNIYDLTQIITLGNNGGTFDTNGNWLINTGNVSGSGDLSVVGGGSFGIGDYYGNYTGNSFSISCNNLSINNTTFYLVGNPGTLNGGAGGSASLNATGFMSLDPSIAALWGGNGTDNNNGDGGAGGAATVSVGGLNLNTGSDEVVVGGNGGNATGSTGNGGAGGDSVLVSSGAVTIDSGILAVGNTGMAPKSGNGGNSANGNGGNGGNASVSIGSDLTLTASNNPTTVMVIGGAAGNATGATGDGGTGGDGVVISSGAVSVDSSYLIVGGGLGGNSNAGIGGNGGNALLSTGDVSLNNFSALNLTGGTGGNASTGYGSNADNSGYWGAWFNSETAGDGSSGVTAGNAGASGSVTAVMGNLSSNQSTMTANGGTGDNGGSAGSGGFAAWGPGSGYSYAGGGNGGDNTAGSNGADGGNVSLTTSSSNLLNGTVLTLAGGNGGNGGGAGNGGLATFDTYNYAWGADYNSAVGGNGGSNNIAGNGGNGGNAAASMGPVSMDASTVVVTGGNGGNGGNAGSGGDVVYGDWSYISNDTTGNGGNGNTAGNGGNGGSAALTVSSLSVNDGSTLLVTGGNGGNGGVAGLAGNFNYIYGGLGYTSNYGTNGSSNVQGIGGIGGAATFTSAGPVSIDSSILIIGNSGKVGFGPTGDRGVIPAAAMPATAATPQPPLRAFPRPIRTIRCAAGFGVFAGDGGNATGLTGNGGNGAATRFSPPWAPFPWIPALCW